MEKDLVKLLVQDLKGIGWDELDIKKLGADYIIKEIFEESFKRINGDIINALNLKGKEDKILEIVRSKMEASDLREFLEYLKRGIHDLEVEGKKLSVKLIDYENIENNDFSICVDLEFSKIKKIKPDITFFINGIPIIILEAKDPQRLGEKAREEALNQLLRYGRNEPSLFKFVQIGIAYTERDTAVYIPMFEYGKGEPRPYSRWRYNNTYDILDFLKRERILDILRWFTFYKGKNKKIIPRYVQYWTTVKAIERARSYISGMDNKNRGLIWHWQGSGKTYTMIYIAYQFFWKFYDRDPIIFFIVDRKDLQDQLYEDFLKDLYAPDFTDRIEVIKRISDLKKILQEIKKSEITGTIRRGVYIVLIQKFRPEEMLDLEPIEKKEILLLIDEAHRSQYGVLGATLEKILPNAIFYAFTGTPVMRFEKNTFAKFSPKGELYLDKYFIEDSIRDGYTVPWRYRVVGECNGVRVSVNPEEIRSLIREWVKHAEEIGSLDDLAEEEEENLVYITKKEIRRRINKITAFLENPKYLKAIAEYIAENIEQDTEKFKFKAMVVTASRLASVRMKRFLDEALTRRFGEEARNWSEVVITYAQNDKPEVLEYLEEFLEKWKGETRDWEKANEIVRDTFKDENEEFPRILIVTDMLITGFDCPRLKVMYLYKQLYDHRLLQAIARVNRPYKDKQFGLIIDFAGIIDKAKEAIKEYELLDKDTIKQLDSAVSELDRAFEEFKSLLLDVKKELKALSIGEHEISLDIEEILNSFDYSKLDYTAKILAIGFISSEPNAVRVMGKIRRVVQLYDALGSYPDKLSYHGLVCVLRKLYNAIRHYEKGRKLPRWFWDDLISLIHDRTAVPELDVIREETFGIEDLEKLIEEIGRKKVSIDVALEAILTFRSLLDLEPANPAYKHIYERIKELEREWLHRLDQLKLSEFYNLAREFIDYKKKREALGVVDRIVSDAKIYVEKKFGIGVEFKEFKDKLKEIAELLKNGKEILDQDRKKLRVAIKKDLYRAKNKFKIDIPVKDVDSIVEDILHHAEEELRRGAS